MSVWNNEDYVFYAVNSIINQTYTDFEFIILDDKGDDNSIDIIKKQFKDERIKFVDNGENLGLSESVNKGISLAKGEYIALIDADDIALPTRLEKQVAYMDAYSDVGVLGTSAYNISAEGDFISLELQPVEDEDIRFQMLVSPPFYHPSIMYRRSLIAKHKLTYKDTTSVAMDMEFWWEIGQHCKLANLEEPLLLYRLHNQSISHLRREMQIEEKIAISLERLEELVGTTKYNEQVEDTLRRILSRSEQSMANTRVVIEGLHLLMQLYCGAKAIEPTSMMRVMVGKWILKSVGKKSLLGFKIQAFHCIMTQAWRDVAAYSKTLIPYYRVKLQYSQRKLEYQTVNMTNPKISVIMPAYNAEAYIETAIQSILDQTCANFELIIVDDGSTDETLGVIESIHDRRIILIKNKQNMGAVASMNRGMQQAKGEYIARMDADDIACPQRFEKQLAVFEKHPHVVVVGTAAYTIDEYGNTLSYHVQPVTDEEIRFQQLLMPAFYHPSCMYRVGIIREHDLKYDSDLLIAEDMEFWNQLLEYGNGYNLTEPLICYRKHSQSLCASNQEKIIPYFQKVSSQQIKDLRPIGEFHKKCEEAITLMFTKKPASSSDIRFVFKTLRHLLDCYVWQRSIKKSIALKAQVMKWMIKTIWFHRSFSFRITMLLQLTMAQPSYTLAVMVYAIRTTLWIIKQNIRLFLTHH